MPSFTFVSTANAAVLRGATPVFVDIDPATLNIDPNRVRDAITDRTKAIFAVHYAGFPAEMDQLMDLARRHDLIVVEDAAQALGSAYKGRPAGGLADMGAFSFHETKNILSGEGGALTINRPDLIERAKIVREKGTNRSQFIEGMVDKYTWVDLGSSFLPGELIAAFLYGQLEHIDRITERRLALFNHYFDAFADFPERFGIQLPKSCNDVNGNGHMANITPKDPVTLGLTTQRELDAAVAKAAKAAGAPAPVDTRFEGDRDALIEQLRREREQHAREAEAALADADGEALRDEVVPGIRDPFKNTPVE